MNTTTLEFDMDFVDFLDTLETLDLAKVRAAATYAQMVRMAGNDIVKLVAIDGVVNGVFAEIRKDRAETGLDFSIVFDGEIN